MTTARSKGQMKFMFATKPKTKVKKKVDPKTVQKAQGYQAAVARRAQAKFGKNSPPPPTSGTGPTSQTSATPPMPFTKSMPFTKGSSKSGGN